MQSGTKMRLLFEDGKFNYYVGNLGLVKCRLCFPGSGWTEVEILEYGVRRRVSNVVEQLLVLRLQKFQLRSLSLVLFQGYLCILTNNNMKGS
jgi:hypothetical protein